MYEPARGGTFGIYRYCRGVHFAIAVIVGRHCAQIGAAKCIRDASFRFRLDYENRQRLAGSSLKDEITYSIAIKI